MDCQGALAAAIVVAGAFYIVNGKLGGKIYSTTNYIKNRYGQKLSAYEVAEYLGFASPYPVYKWINGKSMPTVDNLVILADLFNTTIEERLVIK